MTYQELDSLKPGMLILLKTRKTLGKKSHKKIGLVVGNPVHPVGIPNGFIPVYWFPTIMGNQTKPPSVFDETGLIKSSLYTIKNNCSILSK